MAPTRLASKPIGVNENLNGIMSRGITTRSKQLATLKTYKDSLKAPNKRKADSPLKDITAKRAAFGDITNAFNKACTNTDKDKAMVAKKVTVESKMLPTLKSIKPQATLLNGKASKTKQLQKAATNAIETVQKHFAKDPPKQTAPRAQNGILKNMIRRSMGKENQNQSSNSAKSARSDVSGEPSLYTTALENIPNEATKDGYKVISEKLDKVNLDDSHRSLEEQTDIHKVPEGVVDFDKENWSDPLQVSRYAMDIFTYLKSREPHFLIDDYLQRMKGITSWMRALLVDWMVEVQESFELNHETLYLAVKLVDLYLTKSSRTQPEKDHLSKEELQLLGASALFIAAKFDERIPPLVDDFLYICDGAYTLSQLLKMEITILRVVDFDLGIPLSYRFLRRYARVSYTIKEILPVVLAQNATLHKKPKSAISTVRNKYSHTIFFEVAKIPLVEDSVLSDIS
ncbi:jg24213 [Pararge aegeria aegeria]|uniref:Jg24213 protein n=1 Tax=Pararge aegeria aegeria TaxID=348720 RepID=A0A8S4RQ60_9NEOP|nr:jg24213 [Pararge aegeria aegeria]